MNMHKSCPICNYEDIPFQYCYSKNGNRVSDEVMKNRLIEYAKKNRFSCGG